MGRPKWRRHAAVQVVGENVEMDVPSTRHADHEVAVGKPAVHHPQQDVVAAGFQLECDFRIRRILAPPCGQEPWGLAACDLPVDDGAAVILSGIFPAYFLVRRQLGMIEFSAARPPMRKSMSPEASHFLRFSTR